ncbi:type VI secretion system tip protein VgrG, partial [Enterobacter quasiroggenkampii]|nr:type VI secretion system tip protein VgrG [Enterobacter quasiroggenkampii]
AFMKLAGGNMELGAPGNILLKCANVQKMGSADYDAPKPELSQGYCENFIAQDKESGDILANTRYRITTADGSVYEGRTDSEGKTAEIFGAAKSKINIELLGG